MEKMINEGASLNVCQTVKVWWPYNNYKGVKLVPEEATKSIDTPQIPCRIQCDMYKETSAERDKCLNNSDGTAR